MGKERKGLILKEGRVGGRDRQRHTDTDRQRMRDTHRERGWGVGGGVGGERRERGEGERRRRWTDRQIQTEQREKQREGGGDLGDRQRSRERQREREGWGWGVGGSFPLMFRSSTVDSKTANTDIYARTSPFDRLYCDSSAAGRLSLMGAEGRGGGAEVGSGKLQVWAGEAGKAHW